MSRALDRARASSRWRARSSAASSCSGCTGRQRCWCSRCSALAALALVALRYDETVPQRNPQATRLVPLLRTGPRCSRHPTFRAWAALLCCTFGGLFFLLAGSSFVFIERARQLARRVRRDPRDQLARLHRRHLVVPPPAAAPRAARRGAARRAGSRSPAGWAWRAEPGRRAQRVGDHRAAVAVSRSGTASTSPAGRPARSGRSREKAGTAASVSGFLMMLTAFGVGLWLGREPERHGVPGHARRRRRSACWSRCVAWTLVQRHG